MMSTVLLVVVGALVIAATGWWLVGKFGSEPLEPNAPSDYEPLATAIDVHETKTIAFDTAVRGYHMAQVDGAMNQLLDVIRAQDEDLRLLRQGTVAGDSVGDVPVGDDTAHDDTAHDGSAHDGSAHDGSAGEDESQAAD
jgi:hypothetical protein